MNNNNTTEQKTYKQIDQIFIPPIQPEGAGARVRKIVGNAKLRRLDPFLMLDHFNVKLPAGFPDHPHRGFETVTYMLEGEVHHEDFKGNKGRLGPGDLQWMTAGKGILHAEMPGSWEEESIGFQLWINLAAKDKFCEPEYQEFSQDKVHVAEQEGVTVKVIAGEALGVKGIIHARTPALYIDVHMKANTRFEQVIPKGWNAFSYVYKGTAFYGEAKKEAMVNSCVVLKKDENEVLVVETKEEEAKFVLIAGLPLNEPVVKHGPFVLSDEKQLAQTFEDYHFGQNGFEAAPGWSSEIQRMSRRTKSVLF